MKKIRSKIALGLLLAASGALTSCGGNDVERSALGTLTFWSSFGSTYSNQLDPVVAGVANSTGIKITHISQKSYDNIKTNMISAIAVGDYPDIAMGYPDHFAEYLGSDILVPFNDYMTQEELSDYFPDYMKENHMYDKKGNDKIYGIPFNKSTEVLGYNGTFVEYCKTLEGRGGEYATIGTIPTTWQEWAIKGPTYRKIYDDLIDNEMAIYGVQDNTGLASNVVAAPSADDVDGDGRTKLIDFKGMVKGKTRVISWDATDNAFITLLRQWGAEYTKLPDDQKDEHPLYRTGNLLFASSVNKPKAVECLNFFKGLSDKGIFGIPDNLNSTFSSEAFASGNVMFMVCSSGGLSYNTKGTWENRFRVAPIPYYDDGNGTVRKFVISQGANICMTKKANPEEAVKVVKGLTSGEFQTQWCLNTGYYPCSIKSANSAEYKAFLDEGKPENIQKYATEQSITYDEAEKIAYASASKVAFREGSEVNTGVYMNAANGWTKFVDDAFIGSSTIREVVKLALKAVFEKGAEAAINDIISNSRIKDCATIDIIK